MPLYQSHTVYDGFQQKSYIQLHIKGHINHCTLLSMFSTRGANHKIKRLHERILLVLLNDESSTFNGMLSKRNNNTIHVKNIQKLMIEFYKYFHGLSAPIMK